MSVQLQHLDHHPGYLRLHSQSIKADIASVEPPMGPDVIGHLLMACIRFSDCLCYYKVFQCVLFARFHPDRNYLRTFDEEASSTQTSKT